MAKSPDWFGIAYDIETQRKVSLFLAAPAVLTAVAMGFNVERVSAVSVLGMPLATLLLWIATPVVHDRGKGYMRRMVAKHGLASTVALQLRTNSGYQITSRRQRIEEITGIRLSTKRQELVKPDDADAKISHAVDILRGKLRGRPDAVVLRRVLKSYGFWRNMAGNRGLGAAVSLLSAAIATFGQWYIGPTWPQFIVALIGLATALAWTFYVTDKRFLAVSQRYSDELFASMGLL